MKIRDIINEDTAVGSTTAGVFASVAFPMTPGTTEKQARAAVDPKGYLGKGKKKKTPGYTQEVKVIRR